MAADRRGKIRSGLRRMLRPLRSSNDDSNNSLGVKDSAQPPLPYLPSERAHHLTPRPSRESIAAPTDQHELSSYAAATSAITFFTMLPPELRATILEAAFGQRTLHLDLWLNYPLDTASTSSKRHCNGQAPLDWNAARDFKASKTWQWWSCVCHRLQPPLWEQRSRARGHNPYRFPRHDECIRGEAAFCEFWPSKGIRNKCSVGAMGWMLACRQA